MQLETLKGNLKAAKAQHEANLERSKQLADQLKLCEADLAHCFVKAEKGGMAIYPTAEPWKWAPEIEVGANVYMGQTLLLMPDLSKMLSKTFVNEVDIRKVKPGQEVEIGFDAFPEKQFLLFGDSGQEDPRIYSQLASAFPNRIRAIYIREVEGGEASQKDYPNC